MGQLNYESIKKHKGFLQSFDGYYENQEQALTTAAMFAPRTLRKTKRRVWENVQTTRAM